MPWAYMSSKKILNKKKRGRNHVVQNIGMLRATKTTVKLKRIYK
jgi:hypothetical protein